MLLAMRLANKSAIDSGERYSFLPIEKKLKAVGLAPVIFFAYPLHFSRNGRALYFLAFSTCEFVSRYSLPTLLLVQHVVCNQDSYRQQLQQKISPLWHIKNAHRKMELFPQTRN